MALLANLIIRGGGLKLATIAWGGKLFFIFRNYSTYAWILGRNGCAEAQAPGVRPHTSIWPIFLAQA
jgi:hypothetical protein